jgi:antitoxin component YwqK of YwqJK toxin-antitoxin module
MNYLNLFAGIVAISFFFVGCRELKETKYDSGQIKEKYYVISDPQKKQVKDGPYSAWYENGKKSYEVTYKNGNPFGPSSSWYENGQISRRGIYNEGGKITDGPDTSWYENGQIETIKINNNGQTADGTYIQWNKNGQKESESTYKNGEMVLLCRFYENGQKESECPVKNWKKDGMETFWNENGQKKHETSYKNGIKDGIANFWHDNGVLRKSETYKEGILLDTREEKKYGMGISGEGDKTTTMTKEAFENKFKRLSPKAVKAILGRPNQVTGDSWSYNLTIYDELSENTFHAVTIMFGMNNNGTNDFNYLDYPY